VAAFELLYTIRTANGGGGTIGAMALSRLPPTDTRQLFRPVSSEFVILLDRFQPEDWQRPTWTLRGDSEQWTLWAGAAMNPTTRVRFSDDTAWRLLFHALPPDSALAAIQIDGRQELAQPLLSARSVIV
jgi:hypothetical protein